MSRAATLHVDTHHRIGAIDPRLFSGFLEHLGRAIYGGVYDPGNPLSDAQGFRRDVLDALRAMHMPLVRYPGGNFVSNYHWQDGVGPREQRPARPEFAWKSIEPNTFGTDEFCAWCRELGSAPMLAVNLGTAGAREAGELLEYCNLQAGTAWADARGRNGRREPHGVPVWCLGNEMDGPWQAGHVPAEEYASRARQAGALMKGLDPSIQLVACGSSANFMPTYMAWDREVLETCWDQVDFISAHRYTGNHKGTAWYLGESLDVERTLADYRSVIGYVRAVKKSTKRVHVSFDEWNVWYRATAGDGGWTVAPPLLEEVYNLEDALVAALFLNAFIRNADLVKIACLAQIVNVIAPILTRPDGFVRQTIFHPFVMFAQHARGDSLRPVVTCATYDVDDRCGVPVLDASVALEGDGLHVFLVNRQLEASLSVDLAVTDRPVTSVVTVEQLAGSDPKLANTPAAPDAVTPYAVDPPPVVAGRVSITLPPLSLTRLELRL